jgi:extracellular factor (EF) 3-hydroxypalmitic acid methyl ester biosynthesis protein
VQQWWRLIVIAMEKDNKNLKQALSGETGGFVVCHNSQGTEMHAPVRRMTRHQVSFEVTMPQVVLRTSEVLSDFKITVRDATVYSGRAVVSGLVNSGGSLVCEAALDESWVDEGIFALLNDRSKLKDAYNQFVKQWERLYKIRPELKVLIADMQVFLTDLRLWLEQVELGIRSTPTGDRVQLEKEIVRALAPSVIGTLNPLFEQFEILALDIDEDQKLAHHTYIKRQIHPLVLCSPFAYRTFKKPLGYAGDYEMVNMILRDPQEGGSLFAKVLNTWFIEQPPAEAHRNRIKYLTQKLIEETVRVRTEGRVARVFNLGCGPAQEVQSFLANHNVCDSASLTLLDFNDETLAFTKDVLTDFKTRYGRRTPIQLIKKSVVQVLKGGARAANGAGEKYDFVYCAGLFDYLPDKICRQLMNIFYDMVAPGGLLVSTNVDRSNPIQQMLDYVLEWHLIYRNGQQMATLRPDDALPDDASVVADPTGVNIYLEVRKPAE